MHTLILSAFSDEYAEELEKQCEALVRFGIKYMEVRRADGKNVSEFTECEAKRIRKTLDAFGIGVSAVGSPLGKTLPSEASTEQIERVFETAEILGAKYVRVFSFYLPEGAAPERCRGEVLAGMERIVAAGERHGILPCHENEAKIYGESPQRCLELLQYFGGKLGCVLDMGNFVLDGYDAWNAYKLLEEHIEYFHVKDSLAAGAVVPAGKGEARIADILHDYRINGKKDTFITLEPHLQTFAGLNALVGKSFENPYKYENQEEAFADAVRCLRGLL